MILRGIDRAHDIDLGPSNGTHTRGPVSGGLVQPAPPIPSGRKGEKLPRGNPKAARAGECGNYMPKSGAYCFKAAGHRDHCRRPPSREPIA